MNNETIVAIGIWLTFIIVCSLVSLIISSLLGNLGLVYYIFLALGIALSVFVVVKIYGIKIYRDKK